MPILRWIIGFLCYYGCIGFVEGQGGVFYFRYNAGSSLGLISPGVGTRDLTDRNRLGRGLNTCLLYVDLPPRGSRVAAGLFYTELDYLCYFHVFIPALGAPNLLKQRTLCVLYVSEI